MQFLMALKKIGYDANGSFIINNQGNRISLINDLPIKFTPVEQGGGPNQSTNKINLGWDGSNLLLSVDHLNQGPLALLNAIFSGIKQVGYDASGPFFQDIQGGRINFLYPVNTRLDLLEQQKANVNGTLGTFFQGGEFRATASYRFDVDAGGMSAVYGDCVQLSGKRCLYLEAGGSPNIVLEKTGGMQFNTFNGINKFKGWTVHDDTIAINKPADGSKNTLVFTYMDIQRFFLSLGGNSGNDFTIVALTDDGKLNKRALITLSRDTEQVHIYGLCNTAADIAEHYEADNDSYKPGTLMSIGGEKEITLCTDPQDFFGVISSNPSFLMNHHKEKDLNYYPIALTGRVPVRVEGTIKKGQRITVGENGVAKAKTKDDELTIGRSLEDKTTEDEALVSCIIQCIL